MVMSPRIRTMVKRLDLQTESLFLTLSMIKLNELTFEFVRFKRKPRYVPKFSDMFKIRVEKAFLSS